MAKDGVQNQMAAQAPTRPPEVELPRPSVQFRRKAWLEFQRALDPLAPPKPLRSPRPR
jgi:hypothetical protein